MGKGPNLLSESVIRLAGRICDVLPFKTASDGSANVGDGRRAENTETASYAQVDATGSDHPPF